MYAKRIGASTISAILVFLLGCDNPSATSASAVERRQGNSVFVPAALAAHVPDNALAYVRLPAPLGILTAPKETVLGPAQRDEAVINAVANITSGIDETLAQYPILNKPAVALLLSIMRSPLEVIVAPVPGSQMPTPLAFASVQTRLTDPDEAQQFVENLVADIDPNIAITGAFADGALALAGMPMPAYAIFDASTGRLSLLVGPGASAKRIDAFAALSDQSGNVTPMAELEASIDSARQGVFAWMNVQQALQAGGAFIPPNVIDQLSAMGLAEADAVAAGIGSADGKARLALAAAIPATQGYRALIPALQNDVAFTASGSPKAVLTIGLPTRAEIDAILSAAAGDEEEDLEQGLNDFNELLGFDFLDLFNAFGGDLSIIQENAGYYYAARIRDRRAFNDYMAAIVAGRGVELEQKEIAGATYYGIRLSSMPSPSWLEENELPNQDESDFAMIYELYSRIRTPMFWTVDGDYAYFGDVPQVLIDRRARGANTDVGDWLSEQQGQDLTHSALAFSTDIAHLPRTLHQLYLSVLLALGDFAGKPIDPWSLPSAEQLGLPLSGTIGGSVNLGDPVLSAELVFENSVLDSVGGGSMGAVAVVGILAAVAIPAYQDYQLRSEVAGSLFIVESTKLAVTEYYQTEGHFPPALEARELSQETPTDQIAYLFVQPDSGVIEIQYGGYNVTAPLADSTLWMTPTADADGTVTWSCDSDMPDKYLPAACRY